MKHTIEKQKRILIVIPQLDAGGSERVILDLIIGFKSLPYEIFLCTFKGGVLEVKIKPLVKEIFYLQKAQGIDIKVMYKLAQIIRDYQIDIVNAHHFMPCFYSFLGTCILKRKKLVYTEHSCPEVENLVNSFYGNLFKLMLYRIGAVIGVSNEIARVFIKHYPSHRTKIRAIVNGVDIERFSKKFNRDEIRKMLGFEKDHFIIGTVANFRKVKNHICLLRAVSIIRNEYPNLKLLFVGTGFKNDLENSEVSIKETIQKLRMSNIVVMPGYQEDIPLILSALDLFCLPSLSEGLPVSLLEAMAAGIPVIGSNVNGIKEVINDRKTGLLFKSNDEKDLAKNIKTIMENKKISEDLAENAIRLVKIRHDMKEWILKHASILK